MEEQKKKSEWELVKDLFIHWLKHWPYFVISLFICGAIGFAHLKLKIPEYSIMAKVSLRHDDGLGGSISKSSSLISSLGFGASSGVNSQDESNKMASHGYLEKVVEKLHINNQYILKEYMGLWKTNLYDNAPMEISYEQSLADTLNAFLSFEILINDDKCKIKMKANKDKLGTYETNAFPAIIQTPYGEFIFTKTLWYDNQKKPFQLTVNVCSYSFQAQFLQKTIIVDFERKNSDLINLEIIDTHVKRGKDLLRETIQVYNNEWNSDKGLVSDKTIQFIDARLDSVKTDLSTVDRQISQFKKENDITEIEADAKAFVEQNAELQAKLLEAEIQLEVINIIDTSISDPQNEFKPIPFSQSISDVTMAEAIAKYNEELAKRNEAMKSAKEKSPILVSIDEQIQIQRKNLLISLDNVKKGMEVAVSSLKKKGREFKSRMGQIPIMEQGYIELRREQEVQQSIYIFLLEKKLETSVKSTTILPKLKVIDRPYVILKPVSPSFSKTLLVVAFLGGILIPIVLIYVFPMRFKFKKNSDR